MYMGDECLAERGQHRAGSWDLKNGRIISGHTHSQNTRKKFSARPRNKKKKIVLLFG